MARVNLPGVAKVNKQLANGERRTYYYAWRGGPLLCDEHRRPLIPGDPRFSVAYVEAHKSRSIAQDDTLASLVGLYRGSSEFTGKAPKTRKDYERYLDMIEARFGTMPLAAVIDPAARGDFKAWRDELSDRPRTADYAWTTLARVLSVAKDRGKIVRNVCERGGRLYTSDRADRIWEASDISAFLAVASPELRQAMMLALWTGQREGDLLRLPWSAYVAPSIRLCQSKTRRRVVVPAGALLRTMLASMPKRSTTILVNSLGRSWTEDGFRTSWGKTAARAGISGLTFHDLRGTAATRLALAGATVPMIASVTGHSLKDVEAILDSHYLGGRVELAEQAVRLLEANNE